VASLSEGRTAAAQCGLFTYKSVPVIFEPPCTFGKRAYSNLDGDFASYVSEIKVKGDVKTWWNEGTAPYTIFSMINYNYCHAK